ncbi:MULTISPECIES: hypothetical protein [Aeromonas]|uniref:hypothetical protein n=1 Tax=Aeromonas TaxID=642 RepID=UPI000FB70A63|nr:hypothetical protein [Aeromonas veronii]
MRIPLPDFDKDPYMYALVRLGGMLEDVRVGFTTLEEAVHSYLEENEDFPLELLAVLFGADIKVIEAMAARYDPDTALDEILGPREGIPNH